MSKQTKTKAKPKSTQTSSADFLKSLAKLQKARESLRKTFLYKVCYLGINGKKEEIDIESEKMEMLDGEHGTMLIWTDGDRIALSIPFETFVSCISINKPVAQSSSAVVRRIK